MKKHKFAKTIAMGNYNKLERDVRNQVLGGVCSGLGNYFGIDYAVMRVLFLVAFFIGGAGLGIYLILWIAMPAKRDYSNDGNNQTTQESRPETNDLSQRGTKAGLVAGVCFIIIGFGFLVSNFLPQISFEKIWPVILIVIGLFLIIPTKTSNNEK